MSDRILIIIGAMKCGTTSLFHYLTQHPLIMPARDKEPHFFSEDTVFKRGFDWYDMLWPQRSKDFIGIEASTTYTMNPKYPRVIERLLEAKSHYDFKFIYILRHPISRLESHMRHLISGGHVNHTDLVDDYIWYSEYARQVKPFFENFGKDKVHLMLLEDLKSCPEREMSEDLRFLRCWPAFD